MTRERTILRSWLKGPAGAHPVREMSKAPILNDWPNQASDGPRQIKNVDKAVPRLQLGNLYGYEQWCTHREHETRAMVEIEA